MLASAKLSGKSKEEAGPQSSHTPHLPAELDEYQKGKDIVLSNAVAALLHDSRSPGNIVSIVTCHVAFLLRQYASP